MLWDASKTLCTLTVQTLHKYSFAFKQSLQWSTVRFTFEESRPLLGRKKKLHLFWISLKDDKYNYNVLIWLEVHTTAITITAQRKNITWITFYCCSDFILSGLIYYILTLITYTTMDLWCNCMLLWKTHTFTANEFEVWYRSVKVRSGLGFNGLYCRYRFWCRYRFGWG